MELNKQLSDCMKKNNLSAMAVSKRVGCSRSLAGHWKTGFKPVSEKFIPEITDLIGRYEWTGTTGPVVSSWNLEDYPVRKKSILQEKGHADAYLTILDEKAEGFTFQTFDDSGRKDKNLTRILNGTLDEYWEQLVLLNSKGAGIYVTVNETDLHGRKKENISRIRALWQEDDDKMATELPVEPHMVIESSPGKYHRYILTDSAALNEFSSVQQVLVDKYGSDPNAKDISRVLRLPGFYHKKDPANPFLVRIIHESGAQPLPWEEVKEIFPSDVKQDDPFKDIPGTHSRTDIAEHIRAIHTGDNFNNSLCSLSSTLAAQGLDKGRISAILEGTMDGCPDAVKDGRWQARKNYIPIYVDSALKKFFNPGQAELSPAEWPEPELIKTELEPVPPFTEDLLPGSIREWVMDVADRMCVPPDYVAVALVVIVSSIIGTSCRIKPKRFDDWTVVPNLWGAACGYPSDGKTPSFEDVLTNSVSRLEQEASKNFANSMKAFTVEEIVEKEMRKINEKILREALKNKKDIAKVKAELMPDDDDKQPKKRRYRTNNASVEKLGEILRDNPRGVLVYRDELVGAFNKWDENGDRPFYLESWSGKSSYIDDKIGRGTTEVPKVCLSILGTIQPDRITSYLTGAINGHDNDGFMQRFQLLIFPDRIKWEYVDRKPDAAARERTFNIIHSLAHADYSELCGDNDYALFSFDDEAQEAFVEWFTDLHNNKIGSTDDHPVLIEHFGKYRSLMPSLALIFHLLDASMWVVDTPVDGLPSYRYHRSVNSVSVSCVSIAIAWCEFLEAHARRIYGMATSTGIRAAAILAEKIKGRKLDNGFSRRTISRKGWKLLSDTQIIDDAIEILIDKNWIREVVPPVVKRKGGPMPLPCFEINENFFSLWA